jgi:hypothetical protein
MIAFPYGLTSEQIFSVLQGHVISLTEIAPGLYETSRYEISAKPGGCTLIKHVWRFKTPDPEGEKAFWFDASVFEIMANIDYPPGELLEDIRRQKYGE